MGPVARGAFLAFGTISLLLGFIYRREKKSGKSAIFLVLGSFCIGAWLLQFAITQ